MTRGGEGLMLHRGSALYRAERSDDLLKFKRCDDADARVIGHLPGKWKYAWILGALEVETESGLRSCWDWACRMPNGATRRRSAAG